MSDWKLTIKSAVNSPSLFTEITDFLESGFEEMKGAWNSDGHRDSFIMILSEWLDEQIDEGKITQWNIICDFRNNKVEKMEQGIYIVDIHYKQRNCLNTTHLRYEIEDDEDDVTALFA